jgi:hypothetical protein
MAYIESHQEIGKHPKTIKAARILGITVPTMIGHLHLLWWWCMDYAQDGDITGIDPQDIADAVQWTSDGCLFIDALVSCGRPNESGFIDQIDDRIIVHDWDDYVGKIIKKRKEDAARKRDARLSLKSPKDVHKTSKGRPVDVRGTVPNLTVPNLTKPSLSTRETVDANASEREMVDASQDETTQDDARRKTQIRAVIVEQWGQPDKPERSKWNAGIQQIADTRYTIDEIRIAFAAYPQRRPKSACNPVAFAREIGALLNEIARASPQVAPMQAPSRKPQEPTEAERKASYDRLINAFSEASTE